MSKYTVKLKDICETFTLEEVVSWFSQWELADYLTPDEINTINERGTFSKESLIKQIIDAYWLREIGFESTGLFRHYCKTTMRQIMGRYAQIIYSASIKFDPLVNEDYTEKFNRTANSNGTTNSTTSTDGFGISSDTPQSQLTKSDLMSGKYATTASGQEDTVTGNINANTNEGEDYTRHLKGNHGIMSTAPKLIQAYRSYIMNIYGDIIEECKILFMNIW